MKKAVIDQIMLFSILLFGTFLFVSTVNDEMKTRNYIYEVKSFARTSATAMARYYERNINMCGAQETAKTIEIQTPLGQKLISQGLLPYPNDADGYGYTWFDRDGDGEPDRIRVRIKPHAYDTFWYRALNGIHMFFNNNEQINNPNQFNIDEISVEIPVNTPKTVSFSYWQYPNAGYTNSFGMYQLDANNCVQNARLFMASAKDPKWFNNVGAGNGYYDRIPNDGDLRPYLPGQGTYAGAEIADGILSPPNYVFILSDGYRVFNSPNDGDVVEFLDADGHCFGDTDYPTIRVNGVTRKATLGVERSGNIFFEHALLNADGTSNGTNDGLNHVHIIPKTIYDNYAAMKSSLSGDNNGDKFNDFLQQCDTRNNDGDPNNNIPSTFIEVASLNEYWTVDPCRIDPNNEYYYAFEDLDKANSDMDYTDMMLDTTRQVIPNILNNFNVDQNTGEITVNCLNTRPIVSLSCPATMEIGTTTNDIKWAAYDLDGDIATKTIITTSGVANINGSNEDNGTITFSSRNDNSINSATLTFKVTDNTGSTNQSSCTIYFSADDNDDTNDNNEDPTENNDSPICEPMNDIEVEEGQIASQTVQCSDPEGDVLTYTFSINDTPYDSNTTGAFSIQTQEGWSNFSPVTINVTVNDGTNSISDSFDVRVIDNVGCNVPNNLPANFNNNKPQGWEGVQTGTLNEYYHIYGGGHIASSPKYSFGSGCDNTTVTIYFDYITFNDYEEWTQNDTFSITINDGTPQPLPQSNLDANNDSIWTRDYRIVTTTDGSGNIQINFNNLSQDYQRRAAIDNVNIAVGNDPKIVCNITDINETFTNSTNGWTGADESGDRLRIDNGTASKTYSFGRDCANTQLDLSFDYIMSSRWDPGDDAYYEINDSINQELTDEEDNTITINRTVTADSSGDLKLEFIVDEDGSQEYLYVDNISIGM